MATFYFVIVKLAHVIYEMFFIWSPEDK